MTSIKRAGRITTFGFAVGAGLLIASGADAAVAAAAPDGSGQSASNSSSASGHTSSARSARTAAKPTPARTVSTRSEYSAPVVQLQAGKRTPVAASAAAADEIAAVPTASAKLAAPKRSPALPTPAEFQQAVVAGLSTVRQNLDELRQKIETLVQNQIIGFQNNLVVLRIDLERVFNPNKQIIYGNLANAQYWAAGGAQTSNLMAAAMVISALKGETVTAQDIITEAMNTDSVARPGRAMYLGTDTYDWVWATDAVQLMETHGIKVTTVYYTKSQEQRALDTIETALSQGKSVIVSIDGKVISSNTSNQEVWTTEHQAVLLGINITKNLVYLNDGANPAGQNLTMSLEDFLDAWQASRYTAIIAELAPATAQATSPSARESISV
ncbi:C39 family peptidase [Mycolicibacterium helvum]|uniref:Peptidase C39-like domain-containing protein n=1 Tax=Mycolicibacterium helvum TaxID=1534349 RepID=A0A7I7T4R0_9MYCO|nr:C39 family peptidase [Mycolicibacterium helvum]BBY64058.1 hypothetical protein MHEL_23010 [Mycolicibacterium helvum]